MMRTPRVLVPGLCLLMAAIGLGGYAIGAQEVPGQGRQVSLQVGQVMRVGDRVITAEDLIARIWDYENAVKANERLITPSLTYLRDTTVLELESRRIGFTPTTEEIEAVTQQQVTRIKQGLHDSTGGVLPYEDWLRREGHTPESFEHYLRQRAPVILKKRVLVTWLLETLTSLDAWHILVERESEAKAIHDQLESARKAGRPVKSLFEDLAVQRSTDPGSSINKGRIGRLYQDSRTLVPEAEKALWSLKDGEFSAPVKTDYGWHIFMRATTYAGRDWKFADARNELTTRDDVSDENFNIWVRWVFATQKYEIERRLPGFDCIPNTLTPIRATEPAEKPAEKPADKPADKPNEKPE